MITLNILESIGNAYPTARAVYGIIGTVLSFMLAYKTLYRIVGLLFTRKFKPAKTNHKYAILIAARNEQSVIGNLLDSIENQDYPKELLTVFVVADNCSDNTAQIARQKGAVCYERFDTEHKTKGFALQFSAPMPTRVSRIARTAAGMQTAGTHSATSHQRPLGIMAFS